MQKMLEFGEFVYAVAQLGHAEDASRNQSLLAREQTANTLRRAEMQKGLIRWTWERGDIEAEEIVGSGHFWTLRLPLSTERGAWGYVNLYRGLDSDALMLDINYLCHLFQREMSHAAERILTADDRHVASDAPQQIISATK
jgi:hypothetical protein